MVIVTLRLLGKSGISLIPNLTSVCCCFVCLFFVTLLFVIVVLTCLPIHLFSLTYSLFSFGFFLLFLPSFSLFFSSYRSTYYMLVGAGIQNTEGLTLLYQTENFVNWTYCKFT